MAGADRKRQKKLEKARKKRELSKKEARKLEAKYQGSSLVRTAATAPFGPCWVGVALDEPEAEGPPPLVSVVVSRRVRGQLVGIFALVDRTCLGVKDAYRLPLQTEQALREFVDDVLRPIGKLRECEPAEAQAVVFHAVDYAASLGFDYHPDFEPALFGPRPESLRETPLAHPARPVYISGPNDDVDEILEQLDRVVGPQNYDFVGGLMSGGTFDLELEDEDEDDGEDHTDTIETTAESAEELE
jgi:hypothetical protein